MSDIAATEKEQASDLAAGHEGLRERKKRESREAMHLSALELVAEHGLAQVTVDQIAERAGVCSRTFFNYWGSKEAAVLGVDPEQSSRFVDILASRPAQEPVRDSIRALLRIHADDASRRSDTRELTHRVLSREPQLLQILTDRNRGVSRELSAVIAERLTPSMGADDARDAAAIHVAWGFAMARSVYAIAVRRDLSLADALPIVLDFLDSGRVRL
ncbi:TetR/AcrR family transcriptional regulator [Dermabacter hominis]|uniref:TetR/AcrR family transcriptional regulator n=1 Tax=Dermabacter hominis TaxID=36740 RepID=UPI0015E036AE|nr:helix-turn-helix domain-containing protein [Dermabacter hominis]